jgi:hypothetical protein
LRRSLLRPRFDKLKRLPLKPGAKRSRSHANAKDDSAFLGRTKEQVALIFQQIEIEPVKPKIFGICALRIIRKRTAGFPNAKANPLEEILTYAITVLPHSMRWGFEQTDEALLRFP